MKEKRSQQRIIDRINSSGDYLGVSMNDIANEMKRLQQKNDVGGMQELFSTYLAWEMRWKKPEVAVEETTAIAMENFDVVALIADEKENNKSVKDAVNDIAKTGGKFGGKITEFYRNSINYNPPNDRFDN